jgi:predicted RNA-binding Zn-ribbon protein involved in translation (DUF1610 family)
MRPRGAAEAKRLGFVEDDWKLITGSKRKSRTRGGGEGRADDAAFIKRKETLLIDIADLSDDSTVESVASASTGEPEKVMDDEEVAKKKAVKPMHSRVILEVAHIENDFAQLGCPNCGQAIKVSLRTVCITSSIGFECLNEDCGYLFHATPLAATTIHLERNDNFERSTDYAVNVLYVLGFIAMGDGCTEAGRLLGLLGLPNDTTMESRSFTFLPCEKS